MTDVESKRAYSRTCGVKEYNPKLISHLIQKEIKNIENIKNTKNTNSINNNISRTTNANTNSNIK